MEVAVEVVEVEVEAVVVAAVAVAMAARRLHLDVRDRSLDVLVDEDRAEARVDDVAGERAVVAARRLDPLHVHVVVLLGLRPQQAGVPVQRERRRSGV